jgi:type IV pilus assembly protein PilO
MSILSNSNVADKKRIENAAPIFQWASALSGLQKLLVVIGTFSLIGVGFYFFSFQPKLEVIKIAERELSSKKNTLVIYKGKTKILPEREAKLESLKEELNRAMAALPEEKEIPTLITEISRAGEKTGLNFVFFKPKTEKIKENFYAEIPVSMKLTGSFHQVARFFDEVSMLYRIVNIENIKVKSKKDDSKLEISCEAVTYMFVNKEAANNTNVKK